MSVITNREAFRATSHRLKSAILRPMRDGEAESIGTYCAGVDPYHRLGQSAPALISYLKKDDPALFRFVIELKGTAVGLVAVRSPWLRGPFLEMLALREEARGIGLGGETVDWVADQAGLLAANLWTTVSDFNVHARGFYHRLGFQKVSELPDLIAENASEILLRRKLLRHS
ncbi:GNAT family N-acetyltransferase [Telmatospirillum sp.]|uniref:GNAT family N-acetyltransferase n=1 Tax=Telmatospirillum sp. TaxID=2079197 RepID=UPI0028428C49|nr:GNAT family N-acetyltransferase [Telmatospirillum sp.]MDR3439551.1 GNAT family N-acetyltransferase [Telmatospirillum sp.]